MSDRLLEDAQRDWSALGQERLLVTPLSRFRQGTPIRVEEGVLSRFRQGTPIRVEEGVLFTTYATLRSQERGGKASRVSQIVEWLGPYFDAVTVFAAAHAMGKPGGGKGSEKERV